MNTFSRTFSTGASNAWVLIIEALAQTGAVAVLSLEEKGAK